MKSMYTPLAIFATLALSTSAYAQPAARAKPAPKPVSKPATTAKTAVRDLSFVATAADKKAAMNDFLTYLKMGRTEKGINEVDETLAGINIFEMFSDVMRSRGLNPNNLKDVAAFYLVVSKMTILQQDSSDTEPSREKLLGTMPIIDQLVRSNHSAFAGDAKARMQSSWKMIATFAEIEWRMSQTSLEIVKLGIRDDLNKKTLVLLGVDLTNYDLTPTGLIKKTK